MTAAATSSWIRANREAAKATAREAVRRHTRDEQEPTACMGY